MDKIIIFKSDRVGDLINISPCLKIIKDEKPNSHITLVCSSYNFQVAKNYKFINKFIILDKKNIVYSLVKNFRFFFTIKYDYLFKFDGKNISYFISYFIKSKNKSTLCFVKNKFLHKFSYKVYRPQRYFLEKNFNNYIFCNEDEAVAFTGAKELNSALQTLQKKPYISAVTMGCAGSTIVTRDENIKVQAVDINPVDTNGAGDMFAGSFLYALLQNKDLKTCAKFANYGAAKIVETFGPRLTKENYQETLKNFKKKLANF